MCLGPRMRWSLFLSFAVQTSHIAQRTNLIKRNDNTGKMTDNNLKWWTKSLFFFFRLLNGNEANKKNYNWNTKGRNESEKKEKKMWGKNIIIIRLLFLRFMWNFLYSNHYSVSGHMNMFTPIKFHWGRWVFRMLCLFSFILSLFLSHLPPHWVCVTEW